MKLGRVAATTLVLAVLLIGSAVVIVHLGSVQRAAGRRVASEIKQASCLSVTWTDFRYRLLPASLEIGGITVTDTTGHRATIRRVEASWSWRRIAGPVPRLDTVRIDGIDADLSGLPRPCPSENREGPADLWSAVEIDELTVTGSGVSGDLLDVRGEAEGLHLEAGLIDRRLTLKLGIDTIRLTRRNRILPLGQFEARLIATPEHIEIERLGLDGSWGSFRGSGIGTTTMADATARVALDAAPAPLLRWWDPGLADRIPIDGALAVEGSFSRTGGKGLEAAFHHSGPPFQIGGFSITSLDGTYDDGSASLEIADPAWGRMTAHLTDDAVLDLDVDLETADPTPVLAAAEVTIPGPPPPGLRLSGNLTARIPLPFDPQRVTGASDIEARWPGGSLRLLGRTDDDGITIDALEAVFPEASLRAEGTVDSAGRLDLDGAVDIPSPRKFLTAFGGSLPVPEDLEIGGGPITGNFRLGGSADTPDLSATLDWDDPAIAGIGADHLRTVVDGTTEALRWSTTLTTTGARFEGRGLARPSDGTAAGDWRLESDDLAALMKTLPLSLRRNLQGTLSAEGAFSFDDSGVVLTATAAGRDLDVEGISVPRLDTDLSFDADRLVIDRFGADVLDGRIEITGSLYPPTSDGTLELQASWSGLDPGSFIPDVPEAVRGRISGTLELAGSPMTPNGEFALSWRAEGPEAPTPLTVELVGVLDHGRVLVNSDSIETPAGPLIFRADLPLDDLPLPDQFFPGAPGGPWRVELNGPSLRLAPLYAVLGRSELEPSGSCGLRLDARWNPAGTALPQVELEILDFRSTVGGRPIRADGPLRLALDERGVAALDVKISSEIGSLAVSGSYQLDTGIIDTSIDGVLDPVAAALIPVGITVREPVQVHAAIQGPPGKWTGDLEIDHRNGTIELRDPPLEIADTLVRARWNRGVLEITDGSARVNRGSVTLGGAWDPSSGQGLIAELENVTAILPGDIVTRWNGLLGLEPSSDRLIDLTGDLVLQYGIWDSPFDLASAVTGDDTGEVSADDILNDIGLDLEVRGGGGVSVANNLGTFGVRWNSLEITGTAARPRIVGDLNLLPGGVLTAAGQPIRIRRGLVQFTGDPLTDPALEIIPEDGGTRTGGLDGGETDSAAQASSMATAGLASGIGALFGLENTTFRPEEIALATDQDTSTDFSIGQQLNRFTALFLTTDLRNSQKRTTLLQFWRLPGLPGLTFQASTRTAPDENDIRLLQRFSWGGTRATAEQPRLRKVRLEGEWPTSKRRLRRTTGLAPEQPWDPFLLFLGSVRLEKELARRGWPEARVDSRVDGSDKRPVAVFTCDSGRHVEFVLEGVDDDIEHELAPLYRFPPFERAALGEIRRFVTRRFWDSAFPEARVDVVSDGRGTVTVSVDRGPHRNLLGPTVEGVPEDVARTTELILGSPGELAAIARDPRRADRIVRRTLAGAGYREVRSIVTTVEHVDDETDEIVVTIDPGPLVRAQQVDLVGADPLGLTDAEDFPLRTGMVLDRRIIDDAVAELRRRYRKAGYTQTRVRTQVYEIDRGRWGLLLSLEPGQTAIIDRVEVSGVRHLNKNALLKNLDIEPGSAFLIEDLDDALADLATFEPIERVGASTEQDGDRMTVRLDVVEKDRWTGEIGLGWNSDRGTAYRIGFQDADLFGRGMRLGIRGRSEGDFRQGRVVFGMPPLPGGRLSLSLNASYTEDILQPEFEGDLTFNEDATEASLEGHYMIRPGLWARGYYRFTRTRTYEQDPWDPDFPFDITVNLAVLGTQFALDRLDNPFDPRSGYYVGLDLGWADEMLGSDTANIRGLVTGSLASEPLDGWTWFQSLRVGAAKPFHGALDRQSRFFAGGPASIRGFRLDSVGPVENLGGVTLFAGGEALFVLNEELRFPVWQALRGAVFVDAGQVWETWSDVDFDLSVGAGVGLRWSTPVGPLWVDAAWPVVKPGENSGVRFSFGMGRTF